MQVGGEYCGGRENALVVLALALAEQLLVPFCHRHKARLIGYQHLHILALAVQNVAQCSVLVAVVVVEVCGQFLLCLCGACHQCLDVAACNSDGQQTNSGQNRIASTHIIRYNEGLIALSIGQGLQRTLCLVSGCKNVILCAVLAVLLFHQLLEHTECQRRLCGGAGLGNDVDREVSALADGDHFIQIGGVDVVAHIVDVRSVLLQIVVERRLQEFDGSTSAQIRTANTDYNQYLRILLDLLGCCLDPCELFLVIVRRQSQPAEKIRAETALFVQHLCRCLYLMTDSGQFVRIHIICQIFCIQLYRRHNTISLHFLLKAPGSVCGGPGKDAAFQRKRLLRQPAAASSPFKGAIETSRHTCAVQPLYHLYHTIFCGRLQGVSGFLYNLHKFVFYNLSILTVICSSASQKFRSRTASAATTSVS